MMYNHVLVSQGGCVLIGGGGGEGGQWRHQGDACGFIYTQSIYQCTL